MQIVSKRGTGCRLRPLQGQLELDLNIAFKLGREVFWSLDTTTRNVIVVHSLGVIFKNKSNKKTGCIDESDAVKRMNHAAGIGESAIELFRKLHSVPTGDQMDWKLRRGDRCAGRYLWFYHQDHEHHKYVSPQNAYNYWLGCLKLIGCVHFVLFISPTWNYLSIWFHRCLTFTTEACTNVQYFKSGYGRDSYWGRKSMYITSPPATRL